MSATKTKAIMREDTAQAIRAMTDLLRRDYGCDFSFQIMGQGFTLAQSNIKGVVEPVGSTLAEPRGTDLFCAGGERECCYSPLAPINKTMPQVKTESIGRYRFNYRVNATGTFSATLPLDVAEVLRKEAVTSSTLAGCEAAVRQALEDFHAAGTTKRKVILYGFKCTAYVWRGDKQNGSVLFVNGRNGNTSNAPDVSFAEGTALDFCAVVCTEVKVDAGGKVHYDYIAEESSIPRGLKPNWSGGGFVCCPQPKRNLLEWSVEREAFFAKMGTSLEQLIMSLCGFLKTPESVDVTVGKMLTEGSLAGFLPEKASC